MAIPSKTFRNRWWVGSAGLVVLALLLATTFGAGDAQTETETARRRRIEHMSAFERERLKHKFEKFLQLPEERRRRCRKLHEAVRRDPELHGLMRSYHEWLETLSPLKRQQLREEKDPQARIKLVIQFKQEQEQRREPEDRGSSSSRGMLAWSSRLAEGRDFPREDFVQLLKTLVAELLPERAGDIRQPPPDMPRLISLADDLLKKASRADWSDPRWTARVAEAISDNVLQRKFRSLDSPRDRGRFVARLVVAGLIRECMHEWEQSKPNDEELSRFLVGLDREEQDEIIGLPARKGKFELMKRYFDQPEDQPGERLFRSFPSLGALGWRVDARSRKHWRGRRNHEDDDGRNGPDRRSRFNGPPRRGDRSEDQRSRRRPFRKPDGPQPRPRPD